MATKVYTASQQAHAQVLLSRSRTWTRATRKSDGLAFVIFPSSMPGKAWYTTETACNCPSYYHRGACSHVLAVQQEARAAREAVGPKALDRMNELLDKQLVSAF